MVNQTAKEAILLLLIAVGIAGAVYAIRPDKIASLDAPATDAASEVSAAEAGYREISIEAAWDLFEDGDAIFADSRHRADFEAGHIQGAVHLHAADAEVWLPDFLSATNPLTPIVTYCDGEDCPLAQELATLLALNGFETIHYLENGWAQWQEKGLPVE